MSSTKPPVKTFIGHGQSGVWTDPNNWVNGALPSVTDTAIVNSSAVLNGSIEVNQVMFLGTENITLNGVLKTDSLNTCQGIMVCDSAVATFAAGSSTSIAGGFTTGQDTVGTSIIAGASGGKAAAIVNNRVLRVGENAGSHGVLTVAGILNNANGYVGMAGNGIMNVTGNGQVNFAGNVDIGQLSGAAGTVTLSGSAVMTAGSVNVGMSVAGGPGGVGTLNVGAGTSVSSGSVFVNHGSAVNLAGGSIRASDGTGFQIGAHGTVSGFGHISGVSGTVTDNGVLNVTGGTMTVTGSLVGTGTVSIGANSTLDVMASKIGVPNISFIGGNATLQLTSDVTGAFNIAGFAAGDQLVMNGIDALNWNGASDVLTLSEHGHTMSSLHMSDVPANAVFHITQGAAGSVISLMPVMQNH